MVKKVLYLPLEISTQIFNRIIRFETRNVGANSDLYFSCSKEIAKKLQKKLNEPIEFVRLKQGKNYIDIKVDQVKINKKYYYITITIKKILDCNRVHFISKTNNK
jgi:hypothetical protein